MHIHHVIHEVYQRLQRRHIRGLCSRAQHHSATLALGQRGRGVAPDGRSTMRHAHQQGVQRRPQILRIRLRKGGQLRHADRRVQPQDGANLGPRVLGSELLCENRRLQLLHLFPVVCSGGIVRRRVRNEFRPGANELILHGLFRGLVQVPVLLPRLELQLLLDLARQMQAGNHAVHDCREREHLVRGLDDLVAVIPFGQPSLLVQSIDVRHAGAEEPGRIGVAPQHQVAEAGVVEEGRVRHDARAEELVLVEEVDAIDAAQRREVVPEEALQAALTDQGEVPHHLVEARGRLGNFDVLSPLRAKDLANLGDLNQPAQVVEHVAAVPRLRILPQQLNVVVTALLQGRAELRERLVLVHKLVQDLEGPVRREHRVRVVTRQQLVEQRAVHIPHFQTILQRGLDVIAGKHVSRAHLQVDGLEQLVIAEMRLHLFGRRPLGVVEVLLA
eukprot:scaffold256_cov261-Pinguiococcus_pyrenoidosus.AAC.35